MTKDLYNNKQKELLNNYEYSKKQLARDFAIAHNPYKEGDVITDKFSEITIKIERFRVYLNFENPQMIYSGIKLNKDLTESKLRKTEDILQERIKTEPLIEKGT